MEATDLDALITRNPELIGTDIDGDYVMLDMEKGSYFGLSGVARYIWDLLQERPHSVNELVCAVCLKFEVDEPTCKADILKFIEELKAHSLVI